MRYLLGTKNCCVTVGLLEAVDSAQQRSGCMRTYRDCSMDGSKNVINSHLQELKINASGSMHPLTFGNVSQNGVWRGVG